VNMTKSPTSDPINERLAAFTDRLLAGEQPVLDTDLELRGLQETVLKLQALAGTDPQPAEAARILRGVRSAVRRAPRPSPAWQIWARGLSYVTVIVVLVLAALWLPSGDTLSGSAGSISPLLPAGLFVLLVLMISLIVWLRRRK